MTRGVAAPHGRGATAARRAVDEIDRALAAIVPALVDASPTEIDREP